MDALPPRASAAARSVIAAYQAAFPGRLRACYVEGSYADGSAGTTSDLDLALIFAGQFATPSERASAQSLATDCARDAGIELDISVEDERALASGARPALKLASSLIYGDDIRDAVPLITIEEWTRDRMHSSWWRIARLFVRPRVITPPLEYPEPATPFMGYARRMVSVASGHVAPSTRDLIRLTGWAATALLALDHGVYAPAKRAAPSLYSAHAGPPWAGFITEVDSLCRARWSYLIPEDPVERAWLRALCEQTLQFERFFLTRYNPYLIAELQAGGRPALIACDVMRRAPLADGSVIEALHLLAGSADSDERAASSAALAAYQAAP